ncbi:MAG TPA: heterodisulfide reductase-related iron-sulfur binding cluster [Spirochaetota bacterium]|nr:heterodisulfide reductase-related iron-sulfur binding cluster [Spirochaetota bacterium]
MCIQECPPGCTTGCPVHVDVRGIVSAIRKGDYTAGFTILRKSVPFPGIISRLCGEPCKKACKRNEIDEPIEVCLLERACVDKSGYPETKVLLPPLKSQKIAVIGGGLSGLTVASDMAGKGFPVVIFESGSAIGGSVLEFTGEVLPQTLIDRDFAVFDKLPVEIKLNTLCGEGEYSLESVCSQFDAVYIGTGAGTGIDAWFSETAEKRMVIESGTLYTNIPKVFAGGSLRTGVPRSAVDSISEGKIAANSINRFLQNASLTANRGKEGSYNSILYTDISGVETASAVKASEPAVGYNDDEAQQEAGRCILCQCLECVKRCEYLAYYKAYPRKYVREVYNNLSIVMGIHHANRMINTCALCGLCKEICPNSLDMGEVCLDARRLMVERGKMPPSTHDFAFRDMEFSNSENFLLAKHQPGMSSSSMVFFPGCQLGATYPSYVKKIYEFLCEKTDDGMGLMLGCCGAPAFWGGQQKLFEETISGFSERLKSLGNPAVVTACPSCSYMLKLGIPDLKIESLWSYLDRTGLPEITHTGDGRKLAVHDSCITRYDTELHESVRNLIRKSGFEVEELPGNREKTTCCGYGGLMIYADREVARRMISRRINESESDYISYCSMCRDNFASQGKRSFHLLDLIFGGCENGIAEVRVPGLSERQENRGRLKNLLLKEVWNEPVPEELPDMKLHVPENVQRIMEERLILVSDLSKVIAYAERSGNRFRNTENGHYIAYYRPQRVTYWVEYTPDGDSFIIHNTYSHRLVITG